MEMSAARSTSSSLHARQTSLSSEGASVSTRTVQSVSASSVAGLNSSSSSISTTSSSSSTSTPSSPPAVHSFSTQVFDLVFSVFGIYVLFIFYAIYQERLTTRAQPSTGRIFNAPLFLMLVQCMWNWISIYPILKIKQNPADQSCKMKQTDFALLAFTYMAGMLSSYTALNYINFPTTVLIKSCKMLPVMLMGRIIYGRKYSYIEYVAVTMITLGIYGFFVFGKKDQAQTNNTWMGVALSAISLLMDGMTGAQQDKLVGTYKPSSNLLMYEMNKWAVVELIVLNVVTDQGVNGFEFVTTHPISFFLDLCVFGVISALGQLFIFHMVTSFGALTLSITTSTRKFFTILTSVLYFGHQISEAQWIAVVVVFAGLGLDIGRKAGSAKKHHHHHHHHHKQHQSEGVEQTSTSNAQPVPLNQSGKSKDE